MFFYHLSVVDWLLVMVATTVAFYIISYFLDPYGYRRRFSGPWLASFTNLWLSRVIQTEHRSAVIHELHQRYGKFVRIGPDHISIADPAAIEAVYGHGNGLLKSDFYKMFEFEHANLFTSQIKAEHTTKRKRVSHIFSPLNVVAFEPRVCQHIQQLCVQWDMRCDAAASGRSGDNWMASNGRAVLDSKSQFTYLAFDITGDLTLGSPFGMIEAQKDAAPAAQSFASTGDVDFETKDMQVASVISESEMFITTNGVYPKWSHKLLGSAPWNSGGSKSMVDLVGLAMAAVSVRLEKDSQRNAPGAENEYAEKASIDLIDKLLGVRDESGSPLSKKEIVSEALTMLVAGGDTTSNTLGALLYYVVKNPQIQQQLQAELDAHIPLDELHESSEIVAEFEQIKGLPYLNACLKETFRFHPIVGAGLPRVVPPGKTFTFDGEIFKEGSVLSVPTYTTNRSTLFGSDTDEFRPERWLEAGSSLLSKYNAPFSVGPRACIGRNLATMNILIIVATLFRRYDIKLAKPDEPLHTHEGFVHKVTRCDIAIKRRDYKI